MNDNEDLFTVSPIIMFERLTIAKKMARIMYVRCFSFVAGAVIVMVWLVMVWLSSLVVRLRGWSRGGEMKTDSG